MQEIWKDIPNYENLYQVSNLGNVRCLCFGSRNIKKSNKIKLLHPTPSNHGYYKVELYKEGKSKMFYVHRIVAIVFIPNPYNKSQVNHIDGNKSNNNVLNLEWCSPSENQKHAISIGLRTKSPMIGKTGKLNHRSVKIMQFSLNGDFIKQWDCISDAMRFYNINSQSMYSCLKGKTKTAKGYIWKYLNP